MWKYNIKVLSIWINNSIIMTVKNRILAILPLVLSAIKKYFYNDWCYKEKTFQKEFSKVYGKFEFERQRSFVIN